MVQTVHTARRSTQLTLSDRLHMWAGVALVVAAILTLAVLG